MDLYDFFKLTTQQSLIVHGCPGFGWDRVNFLSSSWYSVMSWIQYEKNVDNTLMFSVVAEWFLYYVKDFSASDASKEAGGAQEVGKGTQQDS